MSQARGAVLALILGLLALSPPAWGNANRYLTYIVRERDTPESIAAEFYGNRARAPFITEFNGLPRGARLKTGQTLRIPTAYRYKLVPGETLDIAAQRLVGDRRRAVHVVGLRGAHERATTTCSTRYPR